MSPLDRYRRDVDSSRIELTWASLRRSLQAGGSGRHVLVASLVLALVCSPWAVAATTGDSLLGGKRNPGGSTSVEYKKETQIIADIAQGAGGVAKGTGGYSTRQSNKSSSGGGAIYGCRAKVGKNACLAAVNLADGAAFKFTVDAKSAAVGELLFGPSTNKPVDKPPLATNGTGLVKNLNSDAVDGKHAADLVGKTELLFATVGATGSLGDNRGATTAEQTGGTPPTYSVSFGSDISKCAYTANPTDTTAGTLGVSTGSDAKSVIVTESGTASGFHLQVTC